MPLARDYSFCCLLSSSQTVLKGVKPVAKVVFMGTPDFAVPTLQGLIENHDVVTFHQNVLTICLALSCAY